MVSALPLAYSLLQSHGMEAGARQGTMPTDGSEVVYAVRRDPVRDGSIFGRQHSNAITSAAVPASATPQAALCAHPILCSSNVTLSTQHCLLACRSCLSAHLTATTNTVLENVFFLVMSTLSLPCKRCDKRASLSLKPAV